MGRRGPIKTPPHLRVVGGKPPKETPRQPRSAGSSPRCPAYLSREAKNVWRRMVPALREMSLLTATDGEALAAFCQTHVRWREAEKFLDEHGMVYPLRDEKGEIRCMQQFPQVSIARNLLVILKSFLQEFGMTPASRVRVAELLPVTPAVPLGRKPTGTDGETEITDRLGRPT